MLDTAMLLEPNDLQSHSQPLPFCNSENHSGKETTLVLGAPWEMEPELADAQRAPLAAFLPFHSPGTTGKVFNSISENYLSYLPYPRTQALYRRQAIEWINLPCVRQHQRYE